jgi:hypothetical protein
LDENIDLESLWNPNREKEKRKIDKYPVYEESGLFPPDIRVIY